MPGLIYDDRRLLAWAEARMGVRYDDGARAVGWSGKDREIRAAAIFERFTESGTCEAHVVTDERGHAVTLAWLRASFAYPFVQLGLRRLTGLVPAKNTKAVRFDLHLGFTIEGEIREGLPNDNIIVMGMLRRECRFIPDRYRT